MTDEPLAALPDRGPDPLVRMTLSLPTSLRDTITALGAADRRDPRNMALVLLYEGVKVWKAKEKASAKPVKRATPADMPPPPFQGLRPARPGDPFTATDSGTSPVG